MKTKKPVAVIGSDIHYDLPNLELADESMAQMMGESHKLRVPLIIAGDLHESKSHMRAEYVNRIVSRYTGYGESYGPSANTYVRLFQLIGNHDLLNEKSTSHALHFLDNIPLITVVDTPQFTNQIVVKGMSVWMIPYQADVERLRVALEQIDKGSTVILHQGLVGADGGDYFQDPTALRPEDVAGLNIISGHYHRRQTFKLPRGGTWNFIGNPYTRTYGEANDPEKGFQILYDDGSLEFKTTNLRRHIVYNVVWGEPIEHVDMNPDDLVWLKISAATETLSTMTKENTRAEFRNHGMHLPDDYRLDLIPTDGDIKIPNVTRNGVDLMDDVIDKANYSPEHKQKLKDLWRRLRG